MKHRIFAVAFFLLGIHQVTVAQNEVTLQDVISLALEKNYDISLARNYSKAVVTDNHYANGAFLPTLNATGAKVWNNNDQKQRLRNQQTQTDTLIFRDGITSNNLTGSIQLSWTLFDGTRMFATRERVSDQAIQGEMLLKNQMITTIADVITNYYNIVRQKQQLKAIQEQMSVSEERVKLAERKLQVGTGIKPELLQAQVDLNAQRTQVLQQDALISQLKQQLSSLVGMQLPQQYDVADSILINFDLQQQDIIASLENSNYALQAVRKDITIAKLSLHERRGEYLPRLNFNSAYNYSRAETSVAINNFTPLFNQNIGFNYGFSVAVPILNGFNQRRLVQQAKINVSRQEILYDQLKTNVNIGVINTFTQYDNAKKILVVEEETIGLAKENVAIALEGFKRGVTTFIELRTAQQSLADAYNRLIAARYNTKLAETELLRLSGGLLK